MMPVPAFGPVPALLALTVLLFGAPPLGAAELSDPDWPCIQRKVERLSVGVMWPEPLEPARLPPEQAASVAALGETLALRRVGPEAAAGLVADFAAETPGADLPLMGQVFLSVFDRVARERQQIMAGIARYSRKQIALAARIEDARDVMAAAEAGETPDFDRIDALEEQIAWDERIWKDRQQSLTYVCETPVLLEKRLYTLAQLLHRAAE